MVAAKAESTGRFSVDIELVNNHDLALAESGHLASEQVRRARIRGVVDTGASRLVLPESAVRQLGVHTPGSVSVRYAEGRIATRALAKDIRLNYLGRSSVFNAVVEPDRTDSALIGAIVMEDLDLIADCTKQTLAPRDPKQIISEIE